MSVLRLIAACVFALLGVGAGLAMAEGVVEGEGTSRFDAEVVVKAPRAEVWRAWTTNEGMREFLVEGSNIELRIGGPFELFFVMSAPEGQRGSEGCRVLSYIPLEMISFSWNAPPQFAHARERQTWVVVRMEDAGEGATRVRLTHLGWDEQERENPEHAEEWRQARAYFERVWPYVLGALQKRFEEEPA